MRKPDDTPGRPMPWPTAPGMDPQPGAVAVRFAARGDAGAVRHGRTLMPRFDEQGLVACVVQHASTLRVLMLAHMDRSALSLTLRTGYAHYWSISRASLWFQDTATGRLHRTREILVDDDQGCLLLKVSLTGSDPGDAGRGTRFRRRIVQAAPGQPALEDLP